MNEFWTGCVNSLKLVMSAASLKSGRRACLARRDLVVIAIAKTGISVVYSDREKSSRRELMKLFWELHIKVCCQEHGGALHNSFTSEASGPAEWPNSCDSGIWVQRIDEREAA